jgi:hypothetical protein
MPCNHHADFRHGVHFSFQAIVQPGQHIEKLAERA